MPATHTEKCRPLFLHVHWLTDWQARQGRQAERWHMHLTHKDTSVLLCVCTFLQHERRHTPTRCIPHTFHRLLIHFIYLKMVVFSILRPFIFTEIRFVFRIPPDGRFYFIRCCLFILTMMVCLFNVQLFLHGTAPLWHMDTEYLMEEAVCFSCLSKGPHTALTRPLRLFPLIESSPSLSFGCKITHSCCRAITSSASVVWWMYTIQGFGGTDGLLLSCQWFWQNRRVICFCIVMSQCLETVITFPVEQIRTRPAAHTHTNTHSAALCRWWWSRCQVDLYTLPPLIWFGVAS